MIIPDLRSDNKENGNTIPERESNCQKKKKRNVSILHIKMHHQ